MDHGDGLPIRAQTGTSLLLALVMCAVAAGAIAASHSAWVDQKLTASEVSRFKAGIERCMDRGTFIEFEDRLLVDRLPKADYSRGGVYYLGSSPIMWALKNWELTPEQSRVIADYGIGATNHRLQFQFVQYLTEQRGFLRAGPKTRVVLGAFWSMGSKWDPNVFFGPLWERYGLYTYDVKSGIRPAPMAPWMRTVRQEKARAASFLECSTNRVVRMGATALHIPLSEAERIRGAAIRANARLQAKDSSGAQTSLDEQANALEEQIRYIQAHRADVVVVLMPTREAYRELRFPQAYAGRVSEVCRRTGTRLVDLSRLLPENEFWDMNHSNYAGICKTHAALMALAEEHLRRTQP